MIRSSGLVVILLACVSAFFVASGAVFAAENGNMLAFKPEIQRGDIYRPQGLWPLLGVGMGAMDSGASARTGGVPGHIKILGSYYFDSFPFVADAGIGMHNEFLTQRGAGSDTIQSLYTEIAGRYEFTNRWQLGAIWNTLVDNPDRYKSNTNNLASFMGLQALKEFTWNGEYLVRAGGRAMTSVGLNGGSVNTVMAELEVSFGPGHPKVAETPPAPAPVVEEKAIAPHLAKQAVQTFDLDPKLVHFDTASTKLVRESDRYFKRLARALADNHQLFQSVEVVGHTDQRGTPKYNDKLSQRRAKAISQKLVAAGVKSSQVISEGRGETELLSHSMKPSALLLNRRVQLQFKGVKNQSALQNVIQSVAR